MPDRRPAYSAGRLFRSFAPAASQFSGSSLTHGFRPSFRSGGNWGIHSQQPVPTIDVSALQKKL